MSEPLQGFGLGVRLRAGHYLAFVNAPHGVDCLRSSPATIWYPGPAGSKLRGAYVPTFAKHARERVHELRRELCLWRHRRPFFLLVHADAAVDPRARGCCRLLLSGLP